MSKHWPLPERFRVRLTMDSDWHVGSGMGRPGNVDRLITRDADDLPFVPAKTLRGIWRDACEQLCLGLDDGQVAAWSRLVDSLFGSQPALGQNDSTGRHGDPAETPLRSAVQIRPALIPSSLRKQLVRADVRIRQALTFVKPGVKIDRRSGSAQTDMLRFEEMGRRGTILEAECRLPIDEAVREVASALLIASAKLVERLGGKRRRGPGRCRLEILDADTDAAIAWLEGITSPPEWSPGKESDTFSGIRHVAQQADPWLRVPLVIQLQGPLAVSYRTTGNVVETLDFVPGSYLLPHVTRTLSGLGFDVRSALQSGELCVLPAYPKVDGERGQPVPMALFAPKGLEKPLQGKNRERVVNRLLAAEPGDGTQLKQMREGYVSTQPTNVYKPPITVRTHNTVEDQPQRPTSDVGGVYTYEAIAPNDDKTPVVLCSELRIRKSLADRLAANWWNRLNGEVSLGRSKKDDYGSVRVNAEAATHWQSSAKTGSDLFVWLVSDTLLRNPRLRAEPTACCLGKELSRLLGVTLTPPASSDSRLDELVRIRRLDTWHVGWGLPRPSLVALQAGSCMVFSVSSGSLDPTRLEQLEASGIGERTAEGYGQVRLNHPLLTQEPTDWQQPKTSTTNTSPPPSTSEAQAMDKAAHQFARRIEIECWKQELRRACLAFANSAQNRKNELGWVARGEQGQPPMSQLGGLRGQLAMLRFRSDWQQVTNWLNHLEGNSRRKDKWPSIPKVKMFIESDSRIWEIIKTDGWPTISANAQTELRHELWALAVRTFFDACIRAHKRELEPEPQRKEVARGA